MNIALAVFGVVFVLSLLAGLAATLILDRTRRLRRARLIGLGASFSPTKEQEITTGTSQEGVWHSETTAAVQQRLRKAGLTLTVPGLAGITFLGALAIFGVAFLLQNSAQPLILRIVLSALIALLGSLATASLTLRVLEARRVVKFRASLPEALETMARSLRAGRATGDAVGLIGSTGDDLLAIEFRRCRADIEHGSTLRNAMEALAARVDVPDVHFIASAISLQHSSGGNLAETLETAALSLRQFRQLEAKSRALSAEVRMSAIILTALPVVVAGALFALSPEYLTKLSSDSRGRVMLAYAFISLAGGLLLMKRMEKIDD